MANQRLEARDLKVLLLWILIGVAGAAVAYRYFFVAFPEASVDFRVSRSAALELARNFLATQGEKLEGYKSSIIFEVDEDAKTYLEREVGLQQANRLMASEISVWYWNVRFFRPQQKEEFKVRASPAGRAVGFDHVVEEAREGARLDRDAARAIAEAFLRQRYGAVLASYEYLPEEANSIERPKRRDWSFTWERRGFKAKDAPYRLRATVLGDGAGGFEEFLKVPEAWKRDFERLRSGNLFYGYVALLPYALLNGAMLWMLFELARRGLVRWRGALKLGLVLALLFFVMEANEWPLARANYDTNSTYGGFFLERMVIAALVGLGLGLLVSLTVAAAEPLYRRLLPERIRLGVSFTLPGIRSKEFFRSCVIGLGMAAGHIGFVVLFYIVGKKFGVWAPQDINYTNVVSTALPWVYPLTISVYAATSEEFLFRLFAIPFLLRFTKSKWLAVILPALIWGFLHSTYPQEPGYIRGIEVGLIGIVAGMVMLRWGILATLVWHYTVDALLISLFLLRSESLYFRVSGAIVGAAVLIPLGVAGAIYLARRRFEPEEALENRAEPLVEAVPPAVAAAAPVAAREAYQPLAPRSLGMLVGLGVVGVALLLAVKPHGLGDYVRFRSDARQAAASADEVLRQLPGTKVDPATWKRATTFEAVYNGYASEYLRRQLGSVAGVNRFYEEKVPSAFWHVRYFRDSQKEEYDVLLRPDGELYSVDHELEEMAPGANLTKEVALARAGNYLREQKKLDLSQWKLVEVKSDKRPARTDHAFTWEELAGVGEAHVRTQVKVQGDEITDYRVFVKIPEEWQRRQSQTTLASTIYSVARIIFFAALGIIVLVLFFKSLKQQRVPWRRLARWTLWGFLVFAISSLNAFPSLLSKYPTEFPLKTFAAILVISLLLLAGLVYSALFSLLGLAWFFLARIFGEDRMPAWRGMPAAYYRDAFWVALAGTGAILGLARLPYLLARVWPTLHESLGASLPMGFDAYYPAAQAICSAIIRGLFTAAVIALAAGFIAGYVRQRWMQFGLVLLVAVFAASNWGSPADFVRMVLINLVGLGILWWGIARVVRFNLLGYFLLPASLTLAGAGAELLRQPNAFFRLNGYVVVAALLALLLWPLFAWRASASRASSGMEGAPPDYSA